MFGRPRPSPVEAITQPLAPHSNAAWYSPAPSLQQRAEQLAATLPGKACRTLVEAAAPVLFEQPDPFAPSDPQAREIAEWLAREVGVLTPVSAGYVQAYRPTLLGLYLVWRLLLDGAQLRMQAPPQSNSMAVADSHHYPPLLLLRALQTGFGDRSEALAVVCRDCLPLRA